MFNFTKIPNNSSAIANAITKSQAELDDAMNEIEALDGQRRAVLLSGSDDDVRKHDEKASATKTKRDRLVVGLEELQSKHDAQLQKEAKAKLDRLIAAAEDAVQEGVSALKRYGVHAKEITDILAFVEAVEKAVNAANQAAQDAHDPRRVQGPNALARKVPDVVTPAHTKVIQPKADGFDTREVNVPEQRSIGVERKSLLDTVALPDAGYDNRPLWPTTTWPLDDRIAHNEAVDRKVADIIG